MTSSEKSREINPTRLETEAPSTFRMPISFVRCSAVKAASPNKPNPVITMRAGEQVKIRLRNEDAGMRHDFAIAAWTVSTKMLEDRGEEDTITFRAPLERGAAAYLCTPHSRMMSGTIRVE